MPSFTQTIADVLDDYEAVRPVMTDSLYLEVADLVLDAIKEPPPAVVARVADRMGMDATKVAGIWMMFVEEGRK